jgi:hypothetical protein
MKLSSLSDENSTCQDQKLKKTKIIIKQSTTANSNKKKKKPEPQKEPK